MDNDDEVGGGLGPSIDPGLELDNSPGAQKQDAIAQAMWDDYIQILQERGIDPTDSFEDQSDASNDGDDDK